MIHFSKVFLARSAAFLPGAPVDNAQMDRYIGSINKMSGRIKKRILAENGIQSRHYALDEKGRSLHSVTSMGARVAQQLAADSGPPQFLAAATTGGDGAAPGLANLIQGALNWPPLETLSVSGICAASVGALQAAACAIENGAAQSAIALASEFPSRLFKASRFQGRLRDVDFDAHFLRWMLSDGAGGVLLSDRPNAQGCTLRLKWIHQKSFSGDTPTCMQVGLSPDNEVPGYLDYSNLKEAEEAGAFDLRQDIRLLPNLFDVGLHEYAELVRAGHLQPARVRCFLAHYSSERFRPMVARLMEEAGLGIAPERWFSNLTHKGNTGAASIFIMLDEWWSTHGHLLRPGDQVLSFVPESGRFSLGYFLLEAVAGQQPEHVIDELQPPAIPQPQDDALTGALQQLMGVWHRYRSQVFRTGLIRKIMHGGLRRPDYLEWMECWIPQVREGSLWMRRALSSMGPRYRALAELIQTHAAEEQLDWQVLYQDYRDAGGTLPAARLARNPGGEALNAFMHAYAARPDPVGLLGGIYIIEGTGQRIIPTLLPRLKQALGIHSAALRFVEYHGENDQAHMARWLHAVRLVAQADTTALAEIVRVAESVATLYLQQWQWVEADPGATPPDERAIS